MSSDIKNTKITLKLYIILSFWIYALHYKFPKGDIMKQKTEDFVKFLSIRTIKDPTVLKKPKQQKRWVVWMNYRAEKTIFSFVFMFVFWSVKTRIVIYLNGWRVGVEKRRRERNHAVKSEVPNICHLLITK